MSNKHDGIQTRAGMGGGGGGGRTGDMRGRMGAVHLIWPYFVSVNGLRGYVINTLVCLKLKADC